MKIILPSRNVRVSEIMSQESGQVTPAMQAEEIASCMTEYDLLSVPVVDNDDKLEVVATIDDIIEVVINERCKRNLPRAFPEKSTQGNRESRSGKRYY